MLRPLPLLAVIALASSPVNAQESGVRPNGAVVPTAQEGTFSRIGEIQQLPADHALAVYLGKTGYLTEGAEFKLLRTGPAAPGSGLTSVYALRFTDIGNCGSIGCTQIIVTEGPGGVFTLYDEFVGGDLTMLESRTGGFHDLESSTGNGQLIGRFNGTKYTWARAKPAGPEAVAEPDPGRPIEISGECIEDRTWHGYRMAAGEAAAGFGYCRTNRQGNLLLFECAQNEPRVRVTMNMSTRELDDAEPVKIVIRVGTRSHELSGTAYYDVMSGYVLPELDPIDKSDALFESLGTETQAISISINGRSKSLPANGAAAAITLMRQTCD